GPGGPGLAGLDGQLAALEFDHDGAAQHDGELAELGALPRLAPAGRAAHPGDAQRRLAGAGAAHEFVDQLRRLTCGRHPAGFADQFGHARQYPALRRATAHRARAARSGGRGWAVTPLRLSAGPASATMVGWSRLSRSGSARHGWRTMRR